MRARNLLLVLIAVLAAGCATQQSAKSAAAPAAGRPLVFTDLPAFDRDLAQALSRAKSPVVLVSADHITLKQFPPRLERWLAAVDEGGGKIDTQPVGAAEPPSRSLGLLLSMISAIRLAREYIHERQYAIAHDFDARIFYRMDAVGDRLMERIELTRKRR